MNDFFDTIIPFGKVITKKVGKKFNPFLRFKENSENNKSIHYITKHYESKIKDALAGIEDIQEVVDYIFESVIKLINIYHLDNEKDKKLIFNQIIIFINYLYNKIRSKYFYNTLTNNNLKIFNNKKIGNKISNMTQKEGEISYSGSFCIHYALLFKHIFDEIENKFKLGTSNYLFLEKHGGINHAGLVVTFQGKNYLVDSSFFNNKCMQSINELGEYYDRMKILSNIHNEDIPADKQQKAKKEYGLCNNDYYKVTLKTSNDLLSLLDTIQRKEGSIARMYNILNKNIGVNFRIFNGGILILNTFVYHFDHSFSKEELNNINNDKLMNYISNCISYKTNKNDKSKRIKVFDFEKKYIKDTLSYFSDKIDYSVLRRILYNN